jgi:hypothetical protein
VALVAVHHQAVQIVLLEVVVHLAVHIVLLLVLAVQTVLPLHLAGQHVKAVRLLVAAEGSVLFRHQVVHSASMSGV